MWIDGAEILDLFSHAKTTITFDRAYPIALFLGLNGAGKTGSAHSIEMGLTGEVLDLRGAGVTTARMIRTGAASGSVRLTAHAAHDSKPIEIRRRVTAKGVETTINGTRSSKGAFDLLARIRGDADPLLVFRVLTNVSGFFELADKPEETARRQKSLLTGLVAQDIPPDTFTAWPLSFGAIPTTFGAVEEAYGLASARLTVLGRELDGIRTEPPTGEPVTDELIAQIVARIADVRTEKERRIAAQGDAAGRRAALTEALAGHENHLAALRVRLVSLGPRPTAPVLVLAERQANAVRLVDVEKEIASRQRAQDTAAGRRAELSRARDGHEDRRRRAEAAAVPVAGTEQRLAAALVDQEAGRVAEEAWSERNQALAALRRQRVSDEQLYGVLAGAGAPCLVCRVPVTAEHHAAAVAWFQDRLASADREILAADTALGPRPDQRAQDTAVTEAKDALRFAQDRAQEIHAVCAALSEADEALAALPAAADPQIDTLKAERVALVQAETLAEEVEGYDLLVTEMAARAHSVSAASWAIAELPTEDPEIAVLAERLTKGEAALVEARERQAARARNERAQIKAGQLGVEAEALGVLRDLLGPKGVREKLLIERLGALTGRVNEVLDQFGLLLEFRDPWEIRLNGQPAALMGETELMRAGLAFQMALAEVTGARILICDRIGNFDHANRVALFTVLDLGIRKGWIEQAILFSTYTAAQAPTVAPMPTVSLYHVLKPAGAPTSIARVA